MNGSMRVVLITGLVALLATLLALWQVMFTATSLPADPGAMVVVYPTPDPHP